MYDPSVDGAHEDAAAFFPTYAEWSRLVLREARAMNLDLDRCREIGKLLDDQAREMHRNLAEPLAAAQVLFIMKGRA